MNEDVKALKEWTVMVYLVGDNNLSEECVWALTEMFKAGVNEKIGLVAQIDTRAKAIHRFDIAGFLNNPESKTRPAPSGKLAAQDKGRGLPLPNDKGRKLLSRGKEIRIARDTTSVKTLIEFIKESKELHKAKRYLLILSGHSGGPIGRSFLSDNFPSFGLTLQGIENAVDASRGIDVVGMDSCGMGMIEVGYQLHDHAKFLVASEGFEVNTGWPYFEVLTALNNKPETEPEELVRSIVEVHTDYYMDYLMAGVSTDISACDLKKSEDVVKAVKLLAEVLINKLSANEKSSDKETSLENRVYVEDLPLEERAIADAIVLAHWRAQSYRFEQHTDLYDFCDLLEKGCQDQAVINACNDLKKIIKGERQPDGTCKGGYVIKSRHSGGAFQYSNGVAIYFPWRRFRHEYNDLEFSTDSGWGKFLDATITKTRRRPRPGLGDLLPVISIDDSPDAIKDVQTAGDKDVQTVGDKGLAIFPQVKNPPDAFFEDSEDDC